ncbi:hypothetical protein DM15PD_09050 [Aristophania vespae]|nr:hypothetical protein DM15PD_09050 [Aristophania vespae]
MPLQQYIAVKILKDDLIGFVAKFSKGRGCIGF